MPRLMLGFALMLTGLQVRAEVLGSYNLYFIDVYDISIYQNPQSGRFYYDVKGRGYLHQNTTGAPFVWTERLTVRIQETIPGREDCVDQVPGPQTPTEVVMNNSKQWNVKIDAKGYLF